MAEADDVPNEAMLENLRRQLYRTATTVFMKVVLSLPPAQPPDAIIDAMSPAPDLGAAPAAHGLGVMPPAQGWGGMPPAQGWGGMPPPQGFAAIAPVPGAMPAAHHRGPMPPPMLPAHHRGPIPPAGSMPPARHRGPIPPAHHLGPMPPDHRLGQIPAHRLHPMPPAPAPGVMPPAHHLGPMPAAPAPGVMPPDLGPMREAPSLGAMSAALGLGDMIQAHLGRLDPGLSVTLDQLNLDNDETPVSRLATKLLPLLQERFVNLVRATDPEHLLENTASKFQASLDGFQAAEETFFQISRTISLCWVEDEAEGSQGDGSESRRVQLNGFQFELIVAMCNLMMELRQFWSTVRFSKDFMPETKVAKDKVLKTQRHFSKQIGKMIVFLQTSLLDSVIDHLHRFSLSIGFSIITRGIRNWRLRTVIRYQVGDINEPIIPVLKLSRTFMNKISKKTNHDAILFRHLNSTELELLHKSAFWIPQWVDDLGQCLHEIPVRHDEVVRHLAAIIASFDKCLEVLKPYLQSLPPVVKPTLVEAACKWFTVWRDQLSIALHQVSDFVGCDFPTAEHCATVGLNPAILRFG